MKKILLLLCSLFVAIGTWADGPAVDGKTFTLQCKRGYVYYDGSIVAGTTESANASKFAFVTYEETTYLYDATQKAFVCHTTAATAGTTGNNSLESKTDFSKAVTGLKWGETSIAAYPYYLEDSFGNWLNMDSTPKVYFNTWKDFEGGNGGNTYKVEVVDETFDNSEAIAMLEEYFHPSATVTYVISDANGVVFTSEAIPAKVGATIDAVPANLQRDYCNYEVTPVTVATGENNIVNVTVSYTGLPFDFSASYGDAKWYNMKIRGSYWVAMDGSEPYYPKSDKDLSAVESQWAFAGSPYGFIIYNRGAKAGKSLTPADGNVVLRDGDYAWDLFKNGDGFVIREAGTPNNYVNQSGGSNGPLKFWNSTNGKTDAGSTFTVQEVPSYTIAIAAGIENGTVAVNKTTVYAGDVIKPIITPAEGFMLKSLTVKAGEDDVTLNYDNSFTMPAADVTISAEFQDKVYIETDLTAQFGLEPSKWTGASGWCASNFGPTVTTNDGRSTLLAENYQGNASATGDLIKQTLSGLANGTYRIEIYAAAASTHERDGFATDVQAGDTDAAEVYAKAGGVRTSKALTAFVATSFSEVNTCVLDNVEVTDGTVEIGLTKLSAKTNWHIIQIKGVTAKVDAGSLLAVSVAAAAAVDPTSVPAALAAEIETVVSVNNKAYTTAAEYEAAIAAIDAVVAKAAPYAPLTAALAKGEDYKAHTTDAAAISAYETAIADVQAAYDAVTVTDFDGAVATVNAVLPALAKAQTADGSDLTILVENLAWTCKQGNGPGVYGVCTETFNETSFAVGKVMYQNITGLVPGTYTVKALAVANVAWRDCETGSNIAQFYVNDVTEDIEVIAQTACTPTDYEYSLTAEVGVDGILEYGIQNIATGGNWYVCKGVELTLDHAYTETELGYKLAQEAIVDGDYYNVTTVVNETTYYLTTGGTLTADASEAGAFQFKAVTVDGTAYPTGWNLGYKFTNPTLSNESTGDIVAQGKINTNGKNDRDDWERQAFFLKDGKYAVRSTNAASANWGANTYWDVVEGELPNADYSLDIQYKWNLVNISTEMPRKNLLAEIEKATAAAATAGTALFQIPAAAAETLLSAVAIAQGVYDNGEATAQELNDATAALQAAEVTFANTERNAPVAGKAYVIKNNTAAGNLSINADNVTVEADAKVFFTAVAGGYALSNADGKYIFKTTGNTWTLSTTENIDEAYVINANLVDGGYTLQGANGLMGTDNATAGSAVYANKTASNNGVWSIAEFTTSVAINTAAAGWGTVILPFAAELPADVKAYTCATVDANGATLVLAEAAAIEANKPYIIEGAWDATVSGEPTNTADSYTEGLLTGVFTDTAAPNGSYILQNQGDKVAFYLVDTSVASPTVKANHAYLTAPSAGVKAFYLGEVATAIEKVMAGAAAGEIYDLAGRKVSRMVKGNAYIVGGRKVVIK